MFQEKLFWGYCYFSNDFKEGTIGIEENMKEFLSKKDNALEKRKKNKRDINKLLEDALIALNTKVVCHF